MNIQTLSEKSYFATGILLGPACLWKEPFVPVYTNVFLVLSLSWILSIISTKWIVWRSIYNLMRRISALIKLKLKFIYLNRKLEISDDNMHIKLSFDFSKSCEGEVVYLLGVHPIWHYHTFGEIVLRSTFLRYVRYAVLFFIRW